MTIRTWTRVGTGIFLIAGSAGAQTTSVATDPDRDSNKSSLLERPAQLVMQEATLTAALYHPSDASGVPVGVSPTLVGAASHRVDCDCRTTMVRTALDRLLADTSFRYRELRRDVLVYADAPPGGVGLRYTRLAQLGSPAHAVPVVFHVVQITVQDDPVGGIVAHARTLRPIAGARVVVEGTEQDALTDSQGRFQIQDVAGNEVMLRVEMIGYGTLRQAVRVGDTNARLLLSESAIELDEIVVTGTAGGTARRALGHSLSRIDASQVVDLAPVSNVSRLIAGRAAGTVVQMGSGVVGGGARIRIRGSGSLALNDQPLIYVDGVRVDNAVGTGPENLGTGFGFGQTSRLEDFNPEDIESIEIIKGPAAATLYGTEASNGVVQIITKKGKAGSPTWNVSVRHGAAWFHNPQGRIPVAWGHHPTTGELITINPYERDAQRGEAPYQNAHQQGYSLNVSGGSDAVQYLVAGDFSKDNGIEPGNHLTRYGMRTNLAASVAPGLMVNVNAGWLQSRSNLPPQGGLGGTLFAMTSFRVALLDTPRDGYSFGSPRDWNRLGVFEQNLDRFTGGLRLTHTLGDRFTQRLTVGLDQVHEDNILYRPNQPDLVPVFGVGTAAGRLRNFPRAVLVTTIDYGSTMTARLTGALETQTSVGAQYYRKRDHRQRLHGERFPVPGLRSLASTALKTIVQDALVENSTVGLYLQQQFSWKDRLFATGAIRADDNSAFGEDFQAAIYPKVSAAWVVSEELFWPSGFLSTLRLRGAYGHSGLQPAAFAAVRTFGAQVGGDGSPVVTPASVGNPELKPERGEELEVGFEAGLWRDRIGMELTYYSQVTRDAILGRQVPPSGGFGGTTQFVNAGKVTNRGVEVLTTARIIDSRRIDWEVTLNAATNSSEVVSLGGVDGGTGFIRTGAVAGVGVASMNHQEGYPVASWFGRRVVSADFDAAGMLVSAACEGGTGSTTVVSNQLSANCAEAPLFFLGRSIPSTTGSISSSVSLFNRLTVHGLVDFQRGHRLQNLDRNCGALSCKEHHVVEGDLNHVAAVRMGVSPFSTLSDASFFKLRELSVQYTAPDRWARAIGASRLAVGVAALNLKTWTNYTGLDPETFYVGDQYGASSSDVTPPLMSFQTKVNLTF